MSLIHRVTSSFSHFEQKHEEIVVACLNDALARCGADGDGHPDIHDYIASLVVSGTPLFANFWRSTLAPNSVRVAGVFCRQTPMVKHAKVNKACGLGDLLWCHFHRDLQGNVMRNALLLQARLGPQGSLQLHGNDRIQFVLYNQWPEFEYLTPRHLLKQVRNVTPASQHLGAQYLIINDRLPRYQPLTPKSTVFHAGLCLASHPLHHHKNFSTGLTDFLIFGSGRGFSDPASARLENGWSQVVWDLLLAATRKGLLVTPDRSGHVDADRTVISTVSARDYEVPHIVHELIDMAGDSPPGDEDDGAVSVIIVETSEHNFREQRAW